MTDFPLLDNINTYIVNPIIGLLFGLALLYFMYGVAVFIVNGDNDVKRREGASHMLWGVIGLFVMVSVFGIMKIICTTIGCN
ncbi:MAG: hypothetical protein A2589_02525 [Candidatus Vogelbacteria bacterium RIFOXYD1_FULL_46_19]|uniref:Uncharacterized protein n=1 Tax=Candidatus Vogelbacteria bacterium RIFOXYD1_FULL_46_19 TaxID=1802439 RepID=A0A1G2QIS5_9BACT|nr:MAG: hypothetical protein A2589_02525 [Candidatus Vogelbacteria bacterium RIFOXYD1_FULL_46_19]